METETSGTVAAADPSGYRSIENQIVNMVRVEQLAKKDVDRRLREIEEEFLKIAEARKDSFRQELFKAREGDTALHCLGHFCVYYSSDYRSFFAIKEGFERSQGDFYVFSNLVRFEKVPAVREKMFRDPQFRQFICGVPAPA